MAVCVGCGLTEEDNVIEVQPRSNGGIICSDTDGLSLSLAQSSLQDLVTTSETTTSNSYTDLATFGPSVSIVTGTKALVMFSADHDIVAGGEAARMSVAVSGATTIAASDEYGLRNETAVNVQLSYALLFTNLTPGTNIFTAKYKAQAAGTVRFANRRIVVTPG
jgi:hypothetical protein